MLKKILLVLQLIFISKFIFAQDYSNKGKEFWIAYPSHIDDVKSTMGIYITSDKNAKGSVSVNGKVVLFSVNANDVTPIFIGNGLNLSNNYVLLTTQDGIKANAAIKVTSDVPVVVYAHIINSARSGATLVLPTPVLGTEYIVPSHESAGGSAGQTEEQSIGEFVVIATKANTKILITPTINGRKGRAAGVSFPITLANAGDCYQFQGEYQNDLSGTLVKSIADSISGCKPIAVFSASTWSAFGCNKSSGGDNLFQQLFPIRSWGKQFITAPFINRDFDIYRIFTKDTGTIVTVVENGITRILGNADYNPTGRFYYFNTGKPVYIASNKPISVVQYITSTTCSGNCKTSDAGKCEADPEMVILNPIEQTLKDITFFSAEANAIAPISTRVDQHYVNIIIHKKYKNSVKIDGSAPNGTFVDIPATNYAYLQEDLTNSSAQKSAVHNVIADTGFSAIVYGYGIVESYGYNGGTNLVDLYQYITLSNQYGSVNFPAICKGLPFKFSITLPYQPLKLNWDFNNDTNLLPNTTVVNNAPLYDTSFIKDGKILYTYKLSGNYIFNKTGTYNIKVISNNPTSDGCSGDQEIYYQVEVYDNPIADFAITTNGCTSNPVSFKDQSQTSNRNIIKYAWNFGNGLTDSIKNPSTTYTNGGSFPIQYSIITDVGCKADTTKIITLSQPPAAKFTIDNSVVCSNTTITFKDSSSAFTPTSIAKWYWDYGNGKKDTFNVSTTFKINFPDTGTHTYSLFVESSSGCRSIVFTKQFAVYPIPQIGYVLPEVCLNDAFVQFIDSSKIIDHSENKFTYNWNFGDKNANTFNPNVSTQQNPTHNYADTGIYKVQLKITSKDFCIDSLQKDFIVNGGLPRANFTVLNASKLCSNDTIQIQNKSTVDFGNITYLEIEWDTANNINHKTIDNNPLKNKIYKTNYNSFQQPATKPFYIKMRSYSGISCVDSVTVQITLHQSPKILMGDIVSICNDTIPRLISTTITTGGVAGTGLFTGLGIINTSTGLFNPQVVAAGNYPITHTFTSNIFGCVDSLTKSITVLKSPTARFAVQLPSCEKNNLVYLDSSSANVGNLIKWNWNFGNNTTATKTDSLPFAIQYNNANNYIVSLRVTTDSGCHHTLTKIIAVHPLPKVYFGLPTVVCLPDGSGTFSDSSTISDNSIPFTYHWSFGDANNTISSTLKNPTHRYSNTNADTVKLVVTSLFGCVDSLSRILTNIYPQPKAAFTVKKDTAACFGDTLYFTDKSVGFKTKWFWNLGFGYGSTQQNPIKRYLDSGTTTTSLYIYNEHNCVSDTPTQVIIINPKPILDLPTTVNFLQGELLVLKPLFYYGHHLKYQWTPNGITDNIIGDTSLNAKVFPDNDKIYYLRITGNGGCTVSDAVTVVVLKLPEIPNVFSPNGDKINDTWEIKHLESYPGATIQVFDRYGRLVFGPTIGYSHPWNGTSLTGNPLPIGTYYYIINPKNGRTTLSGSVTILR